MDELMAPWIFLPIPEARGGRTLTDDAVLEMNGRRQILGKVGGLVEIHITETTVKKIVKNEGALFYYEGEVRCGTEDLPFMKATVVAFNRYKNEDVEILHGRLCLFNHPCIMTSIGYGFGSGELQDYMVLAFPYFESTVADYMDKSCKQTVGHKRFTEEFIGIIACAVWGLQELHDNGYYCPNLSANCIAVVKQHDSVCGKIWDFCAFQLGNETGKDMDWVRLGVIIGIATKNHKSYTPEIADLCEDMRNGTLKGVEVLKHSALLSVRAKFDNIVALNTIALTHCKKLSQISSFAPKANLHCSATPEDNIIAMKQLYCNSSDKSKTLTSLEALLDSDVGWKSMVPKWIGKRINELGFQLPKLNTFREFLWEIRCLYEHENKYNPPEAVVKTSSHETICYDEKPDFESEVRKSWAYLFLMAQKFAASLQLESCY